MKRRIFDDQLVANEFASWIEDTYPEAKVTVVVSTQDIIGELTTLYVVYSD